MAREKKTQPTSSFVAGAIALVFMIIGYEVALFVHRAAALHVAAVREHPDTVYIIERVEMADQVGHDVMPGNDRASHSGRASRRDTVRKNASRNKALDKVAPRRVENFRFNPNTVTIEDLQRLGFSEKQAQAIDNYRNKGGKFRRREDFAKSFVVADSVYDRLAPYIDIPLLDINKADSAALIALPGIGPYFAGKIVSYRGSLRGYSSTEQLMEIYHFDRDKYDGLKDLITCSKPELYPLWTLPEESLRSHPHISRHEAHGIVIYREHNPPEKCTLDGLLNAGVISADHYARLSLCSIAPP